MHRLQLAVKRLFDLVFAILGLFFGWPILASIALLIRLDSSGPVLFKQIRTGLHGKPFTMCKFRSMCANVPEIRNPDGSAFVGREDPRITSVGRYLREFGLDELPQLWNILRGEMSLIGPRPVQPDQLEFMSAEEREAILSFRPGMTSLAQVSGRNELPWEKRRKLEIYYVTHHSLCLDLRIVLQTIPTVLLRKGVYNPETLGRSGELQLTPTEGE